MEWFKANPGGGGEEGGPNLEQFSVQDDNSDTSSVAGTDSTVTATESKPRTGMVVPCARAAALLLGPSHGLILDSHPDLSRR